MDDTMERVDEDPTAETGDTRIRVVSGDNDTYAVLREKYGLIEFETAIEADGDRGREQYDWHLDEKFVLYGDNEAQQFSKMLSEEGAFDPNVLFFRQRDWGAEQAGEPNDT